MTALTPPDRRLFDSWTDCINDYGGVGLDGSGAWQIQDFGPTEKSFSQLLEIADEEADTSRPLSEDHVHCDHFWITDPEDTVIGFIALRHSIDNDFLRTEGGHIGYSVRPSRRREGHASRALKLVLERARELGLERVLLTCDGGNAASARTIEGQGGVFEAMHNHKRRYWIALAR